MKTPRQFLPALLIAGLLAFLSPPSSAGYPPMVPTLQPYQVVSPQGTWRLEVKPGNREGAGPAAMALTNARTGEIAWKRALPYTFWQCRVNEEGVVGGYAYTKGVMGERDSTKDAGHFIVSFLDVEGVLMHEERTHRTPSSVGMGFQCGRYRRWHDHRVKCRPADRRWGLRDPLGRFSLPRGLVHSEQLRRQRRARHQHRHMGVGELEGLLLGLVQEALNGS